MEVSSSCRISHASTPGPQVASPDAARRPAGAAVQTSGLPGPEKQTSPANFFAQLKASVSAANDRALEDRRQGVGIREGVSGLLNSERSRLLLELANVVLQSRDFGGRAPISAVDQLGLFAQRFSLLDSHEQIAGWMMQQVGSSSFADGASRTLDAIFTELTGGVSATGSGSEILAAADDFSSTAAPILSAVGAAYSAYQLIDDFGSSTPASGAIRGAAVGGYVGTQILPGLGTAVGAALGGAAGAIIGLFSSGKHADQKARDSMREGLQKLGLVDTNHTVGLADGSRYSIGFDGGHRYKNLDGSERAPYDVDFSNPTSAQAVGWVQPLAAVLTGGNIKLRTDLTGYIVNAAQSNAESLNEVKRNVLAIFSALNASPAEFAEALAQLENSGTLSAEEFAAYANGLSTLTEGADAYEQQQAEAAAA